LGRTSEEAQSALQSPQPLPTELILTALVNEIAEISNDFALVLDDYRVIEAQSIYSALTFLLDHLPPRIHLVIATRSDLPLPLAHLRGRGQLAELRSPDLRFTPDEEVLQQQPESVQTFLLQTPILDRLTGTLCDTLTGQDNGQVTLEMLERANLFIGEELPHLQAGVLVCVSGKLSNFQYYIRMCKSSGGPEREQYTGHFQML